MPTAPSQAPTADALVLGDANLDLAWSLPRWPGPGDDCPAQGLRFDAGGGAVNAAVMLARLGWRVRLLARLGKDPAGVLLRERCRAEGLDLSELQEDADQATGVCSVAVLPGGERTFFSHRGCNPRFEPTTQRLEGLRLLYLSSHSLEEGAQRRAALELSDRARRDGVFRALDLGLPLARRGPAGLDGLAGDLDLLCLNEDEARAMLGPGDARRWADGLMALGVKRVALKKGAAGSSLFSPAGRVDRSAPPVTSVDSTASGDAFSAGLAWALLQGRSEEEGLTLANGLGALCATRVGSVSALPRRDELADWIHEEERA